jgi:hypothetical protein
MMNFCSESNYLLFTGPVFLEKMLPFGQLNPRMKKETKKIGLNATNDFCDGIVDAILS